MSRRSQRVDREVHELLRDEPELLALAEAIASSSDRGDSDWPCSAAPRWPGSRRLVRALRRLLWRRRS